MKVSQSLLKSLFDYRDGFLYWKIKPKINSRINVGQKAGFLQKREDGNRNKVVLFGKNYYNYQLVFLLNKGYIPKIIDHINNNSCDDRIENLRDVSYSENMRNRTSSKSSTSKYLGVSYCKSIVKWRATISSFGKQKHLGYFKTEILAALAYDDAAINIHGDFANLNLTKI